MRSTIAPAAVPTSRARRARQVLSEPARTVAGMQISEARRLATALMAQHGLSGWKLVLDNARTRAGVCRPGRREIGLSRILTGLHTEAEVRDTVLHEIAHALVGAEHGHDAVWRATALSIGCSGTRCVPETAARPDAPWKGTCPAGHVVSRFRRPSRVMSCRRCAPSFDPTALLRWTWQGRVVPMPPAYASELAQILRDQQVQTTLDGDLALAAQALLPPMSTSADPLQQRLRPIPVGARVRVGGRGKYAGTTGVVIKRGRTRYHLRTPAGVLTAPFELVQPL